MNEIIFPNSKLIIKKGIVVFIGTIHDTKLHKHHAMQITFDIDNLFRITVNDKSLKSKATLINSNVKHKLVGSNGVQILLLLEPESIYGESIKKIIKRDSILFNLNHIFDYKYYNKLKNLVSQEQLNTIKLIEFIFDYLDIPILKKSKVDDRVLRVVTLIEDSNHKKITLNDLAACVALSESRLQHLFKQQIGISIKRYMLWKRMIDGVKIIVNGNNFTSAAYKSGFADSSHMSRTFKQMFGLTLSDLFKNSSSVQVLIEDN